MSPRRAAAWLAVGLAACVLAGLVAAFFNEQADRLERLNDGYSTLYTQVQDLGGTPEAPAPESQPGSDGRDGVDGAPGRDGRDGLDGQPGSAGVDGQDGAPGAQGQPGSDGVAGVVLHT